MLLVADRELNAFAVPGGVIGINTGLFHYAPDQDALASVIAHELGHLSQHYFARQQSTSQRDRLPTLLGLPAGVAMAASGRGDAGVATMVSSQAAAMQRQLAYSRQYEQEADRVGLTMLAQAGLDPKAMPRMFDVMQQYADLQGESPPEFLLTHPLTGSRLSEAKLRAAQLPAVKPTPSLEYALIRARLLWRQQPGNAQEIKALLQHGNALWIHSTT